MARSVDVYGSYTGDNIPTDTIKDLIEEMLEDPHSFQQDVYEGMYGNYAMAIIHPREELNQIEDFNELQRCFINAYC